MQLSKETLSAYDSRLASLETNAFEAVYNRVIAYVNKFPDADVASVREYTISIVDALVATYGNAAATCAANFYDELAEKSGATLAAAAVADVDVFHYINKEVRYQATKLVAGDVAGFAEQAATCAKDQVARRANQTMRTNAKRDGIKYARVPMGGETCSFCIMLASRGFVYKSAESAGDGNHYHANCRCKVVPAFKKMTVQGYNKDELYKRWKKFTEIDKSKTIKGAQKSVAKSILNKNPNLSVAEVETLWQKQAKGYIANVTATQTKAYTSTVKEMFGAAGEGALKDMQHTLKVRSGTPFENLYAYDITAGTKIAAITDSTKKQEVSHTPAFNNKVNQAKSAGHEVAFMHNHPESLLPSAADLQSIAGLNVDFGVIACHNGDVIKYSVAGDKKAILSNDFEKRFTWSIEKRLNDNKPMETVCKAAKMEWGVEIEYMFQA